MTFPLPLDEMNCTFPLSAMKGLEIIGTEKSHKAGLEMDFFLLTGIW